MTLVRAYVLAAVTTLFFVSGSTFAAAQFNTPCNGEMVCSEGSQNAVTRLKTSRHHPGSSSSGSAFATAILDANGNGTIIGGRPAGCPHNYCGCGLRIHLGISDKRFNLAWNWAR